LCGEEIGITISFTGRDAEEKGYITAVDEQVFCEKIGAEYLAQIKARIQNLLPSGNAGEAAIVAVDPKYFRPTEVDLLIGDPTKAMTKLGWKPQYDLKGLVQDMMQSDVKLMKKDAYLREGGYRTLNYFE
jgi:GDPmannose 4,6-dehydratase